MRKISLSYKHISCCKLGYKDAFIEERAALYPPAPAELI